LAPITDTALTGITLSLVGEAREAGGRGAVLVIGP